MNEIGYQLALVFSNSPAIKWMTVVVGILLLLLSLYKLTVRYSVTSNGRVVKQLQTPFKVAIKVPSKPKINLPKRKKPLSATEKRVLGALYSLQQITFGVLLFVFGLSLYTLAYYWLKTDVGGVNALWPVVSFIVGSCAITGGFFIAYYRHKKNPFTQTG